MDARTETSWKDCDHKLWSQSPPPTSCLNDFKEIPRRAQKVDKVNIGQIDASSQSRGATKECFSSRIWSKVTLAKALLYFIPIGWIRSVGECRVPELLKSFPGIFSVWFQFTKHDCLWSWLFPGCKVFGNFSDNVRQIVTIGTFLVNEFAAWYNTVPVINGQRNRGWINERVLTWPNSMSLAPLFRSLH